MQLECINNRNVILKIKDNTKLFSLFMENSSNKLDILKKNDIEKFIRLYAYDLAKQDAFILANFLFHNLYFKDYDSLIYSVESIIKSIRLTNIIEIESIDQIINREKQLTLYSINRKINSKIFVLTNELIPINELHKIFDENIETVENFNINEINLYDKSQSVLKIIGKESFGLQDLVSLIVISYPQCLKLSNIEIIKKNLWKETELSRLYHENSKIRSFHQQGDFMKPLDEIDELVKHFTAVGKKTFCGKKEIILPCPTICSDLSIEEIILSRRSRRHYSTVAMTLEELSNILYYSYGITGHLDKTDLELRAVPSGGGLYPIDIYMYVNNVNSLENGIYYYDPFEHKLIMVNDNDFTKISTEVSGYSAMIDTAAVTFILAANLWRNQWKYHERGYRVVFLDCGHVAENLHLMSTAYSLGSCCLMGFVDDELNDLLELDGISEHSMYMITVGNNRE